MNIVKIASVSFLILLFVGGGCVPTEQVPGEQDTIVQDETSSGAASEITESVDTTSNSSDEAVVDESTEEELFNSFGWERVEDPSLGISIGYPIALYDVDLYDTSLTGQHWLTLTRKNSDRYVRIEVWSLDEIPERPFGFEEPGIDQEVVLPQYDTKTIGATTYGIYYFLNGNESFLNEMKGITDTLR